ncbi:hypothetical protein K443DRAFT_681843 [Laccaria amethystina LaAM-08-1]|uniref:MYND-type domain-containing protein n=1 Tax=Laccaria amethystina LaAM-08-1 TaxID=1095629 RepID=A0A0C9WL73_9AGAR|nr:hypothetical protein K443DRAFT_681843 [Laccaria amethystina LaAM-08-1]
MTSECNTGPSARTEFIRAIPPERDVWFRSMAPTTAQIRTTRHSVTQTCCSNCHKPKKEVIELRKCSKCKSAWYCSKKCQKENWKDHKAFCHHAERGITRLINAFLANPILRVNLEACLALNFDLLKKPAPDTPFMACVDVGLEPSDITVFLRLYAGMYGNTEPEEIEGMLQINAVTPTPQSITPHPHRLDRWREKRKQLCANGQASTPVVIVEFVSNGAPGAYSCVLPIQPLILMIVKENKPFEYLSALTGRSSSPMSATACLEFINNFIRSDTQNQQLLRMNMREEDRETIRATGRGVEHTMPIAILKEKMSRERIYNTYEKVDS